MLNKRFASMRTWGVNLRGFKQDLITIWLQQQGSGILAKQNTNKYDRYFLLVTGSVRVRISTRSGVPGGIPIYNRYRYT